MELGELKERWRAYPQEQYRCDRNLNLYQGPEQDGLVTQAAAGRQLVITDIDADGLQVVLCADAYPGWLPLSAAAALAISPPYQAPQLDREAIVRAIPGAIAFTQAAMAVPNTYLWGGTVAPNYDCSGLVQAAFSSVGVPLPRDSYQQEAFTRPVSVNDLQPGDLLFFGTSERTTHVALHLSAGRYIHSSGKDQGRNGIGIDSLVDRFHPVSQTYYEQLRGCGRIVEGYGGLHG